MPLQYGIGRPRFELNLLRRAVAAVRAALLANLL